MLSILGERKAFLRWKVFHGAKAGEEGVEKTGAFQGLMCTNELSL
jgi:hypothetical protein